MKYGKIENNEIIYFLDNYIVEEITTTKVSPITKEEVTKTQLFKVYNPTQEQMIAQGWYPIEFVDEVGENKIEDNKLKIYVGHERTVDEAKQDMQRRIDDYDTSSAVNGFYYNGQELWADKATRVGLVNAAQAAKALGNETVSFGIQGFALTLPCDQCIQMLYALEMYALACYNVTLNHKNTVDALESVEDIDAYDYTVGYPTKLNFEV